MLTVYQSGQTFRVVKGAHLTGEFEARCAKRVYVDAAEAYSVEADSDIKAAVARIAPEVLAIPASQQHHISRASALQRSTVEVYRGVKISKSADGYSWPNEGFFPTVGEARASIDTAYRTGELTAEDERVLTAAKAR
jgi:hypothetical protein